MVVRVLVVEPDEATAQSLIFELEREGYVVTRTATGAEVMERIDSDRCSIVLLALDLPDTDGIDVCMALRSYGYQGGIIILSDRASELDRVVGLDAGADDYVVAPFFLAELQARVRALVRRHLLTPVSEPHVLITPGGLYVDPQSRRVKRGELAIVLTPKEFDVLALLASHPEQVVSRDELMERVWDENWKGSTKTLDVTIGRLRKKLHQAGAVEQIVAVRTVGFRLVR